jgi:hypothetical protein
MIRCFEIREDAIRSAMAHNNVLTHSFLQRKSSKELMCFVHPDYREEYEKRLGLRKSK